jgi:hypothetical protein
MFQAEGGVGEIRSPGMGLRGGGPSSPKCILPLHSGTPWALRPLDWHWLWSGLTFTAPQGQPQSVAAVGFAPLP